VSISNRRKTPRLGGLEKIIGSNTVPATRDDDA